MSTSPGYLSLSDESLRSLGITPQEIADTIEKAVRLEAEGKVFSAPKSAVIPGDGRYMMTTLSTADVPQMTVVKSVMVSPRNAGRGYSAIEGAIIIHDSETGHLLAVMESGWVTAVRTAGLSAVAARKLANPKSQSIAFIGCGVQARSHLDAMADIFPLAEIRASGRGQANIDLLCDQARSKGLEAHQSTSPQEAIEGADIVVTSVTLSFDLKPFLDGRWMKPGAFATITDAGTPWHQESMASWGTVVIDDAVQEKASPNKMIDPALVTADLKGLVTSKGSIGFNPDEIGVFLFRGMAIGDFAISALAYETAKDKAQGKWVEWS